MKSGIYKIEHTPSGRVYIGSAKCILKRIKEHKYQLRRGKHPNRFLQNSWNKNGEINFEFSVLLNCQVECLLINEQIFLDKYMSYKKEFGFNIRMVAENNTGLRGGEKQKEALRKIWERPEYRKNRNVPVPGERHGRLVLIELKEKTAGSHTWLCQCDCGKKCLKKVGCLRRGDTTSCGCFNSEEASKRRMAKTGIPTAFVMLYGQKVSIRNAEKILGVSIGGITRKSRVKKITRQHSCDYFTFRKLQSNISIVENSISIIEQALAA